MNARLAAYLSGAPYLARSIYLKGGGRVAVLDRTRRWKAAARAMRAAGKRDLHIALALGKKRPDIERVLSMSFRF
ncbi:hypothetical protein [Devosia ginsengisoli]|uniref:hypothetical protein n=1 Tax=Devosia ginsengisoli TaxID=400770 RepID=UPI0026EC36D9|nr:hypothetical protein [Devosia ginsengisoli]MCR6673273.1 hypothetical protein [Devosia ginsengisoli]